MDEEKYLEYFEILEVDGSATLAEVKSAYERLKKLYTTHSIVIEPLDDEFEEDDRQEILTEIEEAYQGLLRFIVERDREEKEMEDTAIEKIEKEPHLAQVEDQPFEIDVPEPLEEEVSEPLQSFGPLEPIDLPGPPESLEDEELDVSVEDEEHESFRTIEMPREMEEALDTREFGETNERMTPQPSFIDDTIAEEHIGENEPEDEREDKPEPEPVSEPHVLSKPEPELPPELEELTQSITQPYIKSRNEQEDYIPLEGIDIKGRTLRKVREKLNLGIHDVALSTGINYKVLVNIEKERFEKLPDGGLLRWNVSTYAKTLRLDPHKVVEAYMKRYRQWQRDTRI